MEHTPFTSSSDSSWQPGDLPEDLAAIASIYASQPVPRPSPHMSECLMQRLLTEAIHANQDGQVHEPAHIRQTLTLARWRLYLLGSWFWIAGVLFTFLGGLMISHLSTNNAVACLVLLIPLSTVLSLVYALHIPSQGLRAVEASCPVHFMQATMSLALAILAFDILLSLTLTMIATIVHFAPFWNVLLAWLTPLLLLTAISLPLALLGRVRVALLIGGLPWLFLGFMALTRQNTHNWAVRFFSLPQDTLAISSHLIGIALGLAILCVLFLSTPRWQHFSDLSLH